MRFLKRKLFAGGATLAMALVLAPSALAASHHPTGEYEQFGECPLSIVTVSDCVYSVSNGGAFKMGSKNVPLVNPVILQGGYEGAEEEVQFHGAENGDTLSKTPQPVPGGLTGVIAPKWWPSWLQNWFNNLINEGLTGVTATVELARPATEIELSTENLLFQEGTALGLPVKIKLSNSILGSNCYIGSSSNPVQLKFTTGTSGSLEGDPGELSFNKSFTIITLSGGVLVDGTYSAPAASGCGGLLSFFIDPLVNSILGLPASSGNTATLEGVLQDAASSAVKASE